jgi:murein DD-endopeptidase MepM/ murein hydrolase activator NlpD
MTGSVVKFQLAPGKYIASLINNQMSCSGGNLTGGCLINTVIIQGSMGYGTAHWGLSIKSPTLVDVPGPENSYYTAFVVDTLCSDNTGQATLRFQQKNFDYPVGPPDHAGWRRSQDFNNLYPGKGYHLGEDWVKNTGSSQGQPVYAISDGEVVAAKDFGSCWKNAVVIMHTTTPDSPFKLPLPTGLPSKKTTRYLTSSYGHLLNVSSYVAVGDKVTKGQQVGVIAPTTSCSTGPHLHFEVRKQTTDQTANIPFGPGPGYSNYKISEAASWLPPSAFIDLNR